MTNTKSELYYASYAYYILAYPFLFKKKAMEITELNEIKVSYQNNTNKKAITSSNHAFEICKQSFVLSDANISLKEYFFILLLNRANNVIGFYKLSEGGISSTIADIRIAYSIALKCLASGMIICHNHPSNNAKPSQADIDLTKKFKSAGHILDISLLDSIILTEDSYYSFADEGLL